MLPLFVAIPLGVGFLLPLIEEFRDRTRLFSLFVLLETGGLLALSLIKFGDKGIYRMGGWAPPFGINFVQDGLSSLILVVISGIAFVTTLFAITYMKEYENLGKFYGLFSLMLAGMYGVALTGDIFNMYVYLEVAAISSYALVGFNRGAEEIEASFKYLIMGAVGSVFILLGIALLYGSVGSLNIADISVKVSELPDDSFIVLSTALFIVGFGLKAAFIPFHSWLPDAHSSAPTPISAMLSGVLIKVLGIYALARLLFNGLNLPGIAPSILTWIGAGSMFIGGMLALGQKDLKRLLAYSSISQMGYITLAVGMGGILIGQGKPGIATLALMGGIFHLVNHATYKSLLFLFSGSVEKIFGSRDLSEIGGLNSVSPVSGAVGTIGTLSISGVPPFNGFWSKLVIVIAAIWGKLYPLAGIILFTSAITLAYYLKVQRQLFMGKSTGNVSESVKTSAGLYIPLLILAICCIGLGLLYLPEIRGIVLKPAALALQEGSEYTKLVLGL
ncbi:NADH/ubiquinone/plastoquinone (complex I) [Candidatus Bipolaricaulota bacterium]|nr:NADH/ubiquinone/plastoquinone (complex I) [Candidatus Bipolaricaulota bacterium]